MRLKASLLTMAALLPAATAGVPARASAQRTTVTQSDIRRVLGAKVDLSKMTRTSAGRVDTIAQNTSFTLGRGDVLAVPSTAPRRRFSVDQLVVHPPLLDTAAPGHPRPRPAADSAVEIPIRYVFGGGTIHAYTPVAIDRGRLVYDPDSGAFRGALYLMLVEQGATGGPASLLPPRVAIIGGDDAVSTPDRVWFDSAGVVRSISVLGQPRGDSVYLRFHLENDATGASFAVPVRPALTVGLYSRTIARYGVESAKIRIQLRGAAVGVPFPVAVSVAHGSLTTDAVSLINGAGTITLRSGRSVRDTVRVSAVGLADINVPFEYVFPTAFLLVVAVGGIAGAFLRAKGPKRKRKFGTEQTVYGVLIALVLTSCFVGLGLQLLPVKISTPLTSDIAIFGYAALAGWLGALIPDKTGRGGSAGTAPAAETGP